MDFLTDTIKRRITTDNVDSPFNSFVGNKNIISKLSRAAHAALENDNFCCGKVHFVYGLEKSGKTTLVNLFSNSIGNNLITVDAYSLEYANDILFAVFKHFNTKYDLKINSQTLEFPFTTLHIKNAHLLKPSIVKIIENAYLQNDKLLKTEADWIFNLSKTNVFFTTSNKKFIDSNFDFFIKYYFELCNKNEISKIIKNKYSEYKIPSDICEKLSFYGGNIPKECFSFCEEVIDEYKISNSWNKSIKKIAIENSIDIYGMSLQRLKVLKFLLDGLASSRKIASFLNVSLIEVEKTILLPLIGELIVSTPKGYKLTEKGKEELIKRKIYNDENNFGVSKKELDEFTDF